VTAQEVITGETVTGGDDFLRIKGIGPTYARRLKDAGYSTFAQVAAATPEEIGAAVGWPVDRVRRSEVIDQAKVLAQH
jgi:large subunit ribosomal protein L21